MTRSLGTGLALCALVSALAAGSAIHALASPEKAEGDTLKQTVEQTLAQMPLPEQSYETLTLRYFTENDVCDAGGNNWVGFWAGIHLRDGFGSSYREKKIGLYDEINMILVTDEELSMHGYCYPFTRREEQYIFRDELFNVVIPPMNRWETQYSVFHWESR